MDNRELAHKLQKNYLNQTVITTREVTEVLSKIFPDLSMNTISWKINQLKKERLIFQVGRGLYSFEYKPDYEPSLSLKTKRLFNRISISSNSDIVIWDVNWLNEFSDSKTEKHWHFIYTRKDKLEIVFQKLQYSSKPSFLQPDNEVINRYLFGHNEAVVLLPMISEMPITKNGDYLSPSLEGLLVNAWVKSESYLGILGFDKYQVFKEAIENYNVNISKLLRYATRRDKRIEIETYIKSIQ